MKKFICKLFGHRSILIGGSASGGCMLCERCGYIKRADWCSAFSELSMKKAKWKK